MAESAKLKIRGIYSTALTHIFLERGFTIVSPSAAITERFALAPVTDAEEVTIYDRSDKQGVVVEGEREKVAVIVEALRSTLPEAIFRGSPRPGTAIEEFWGRRLSWAKFAKLGRVTCDVA